MTAIASAVLPFSNGRVEGHVEVSLLPATDPAATPAPLLNLTDERDRDTTLPPIQLLEGVEYRYNIACDGADDRVTTSRPELFEADNKTGLSGRLRPGLHVGTVPIAVLYDGAKVGEVAFEVRSRKLGYLNEFRWMLK